MSGTVISPGEVKLKVDNNVTKDEATERAEVQELKLNEKIIKNAQEFQSQNDQSTFAFEKEIYGKMKKEDKRDDNSKKLRRKKTIKEQEEEIELYEPVQKIGSIFKKISFIALGAACVICVAFIFCLIFFTTESEYRNGGFLPYLIIKIITSSGVGFVSFRVVQIVKEEKLNPIKCHFIIIIVSSVLVFGSIIFGLATINYKGELILIGDQSWNNNLLGIKNLIILLYILLGFVLLAYLICAIIFMKKFKDALEILVDKAILPN